MKPPTDLLEHFNRIPPMLVYLLGLKYTKKGFRQLCHESGLGTNFARLCRSTSWDRNKRGSPIDLIRAAKFCRVCQVDIVHQRKALRDLAKLRSTGELAKMLTAVQIQRLLVGTAEIRARHQSLGMAINSKAIMSMQQSP